MPYYYAYLAYGNYQINKIKQTIVQFLFIYFKKAINIGGHLVLQNTLENSKTKIENNDCANIIKCAKIKACNYIGRQS